LSGYNRNEIFGKSVNLVLPTLHQAYHNDILSTYLCKKKKNLCILKINIFILKKIYLKINIHPEILRLYKTIFLLVIKLNINSVIISKQNYLEIILFFKIQIKNLLF
jgi:hypothetical protein